VSICFSRELNRLRQFHWGTIYGRHAGMLNQKQFGCLKFLSVNILMTHNWKIKKQKFFLFAKQKFPAR
jgi:hypothetical protein